MFGVTFEAVVMLLDAALCAELPTAFVAYTLKVYDVTGVKPETVIVPEPACDKVPVMLPGVDIAVYEVIVDPPLLAGAV
jgi:hypothetical protein